MLLTLVSAGRTGLQQLQPKHRSSCKSNSKDSNHQPARRSHSDQNLGRFFLMMVLTSSNVLGTRFRFG